MLRINKKILNSNNMQISKIYNPNHLILSLFYVLGLLFLLVLETDFAGIVKKEPVNKEIL